MVRQGSDKGNVLGVLFVLVFGVHLPQIFLIIGYLGDPLSIGRQLEGVLKELPVSIGQGGDPEEMVEPGVGSSHAGGSVGIVELAVLEFFSIAGDIDDEGGGDARAWTFRQWCAGTSFCRPNQRLRIESRGSSSMVHHHFLLQWLVHLDRVLRSNLV